MKRINILSLYYIHLRTSRKALIIANIGFICSLTIISSTVYYFDNSKKSLMDEYFSSLSDVSSGDSYYSNDLFISFSKLPPFNENLLPDSMNQVSTIQRQFDINYFKQINGIVYLNGLFASVNYTNVQYALPVKIIQLNDQLIKDLTALNEINNLFSNSALPNNSNLSPEIYALYFKNSDLDIPPTLNLNASYFVNVTDCQDCGSNMNNYSIKLSGYSYINPEYSNYSSLANLNFKYGIQSKILLFTPNLSSLSNVLDSVRNSSPSIISNLYTFNYIITVNFDYSKIDPYNSALLILNIREFNNKIGSTFYSDFSKEIINFFIDFRTLTIFQTITGITTNIFFNLLLVSIPILITSIFVIDYSFGLVYKSILHEIGNFKLRGATSILLFSLYILDSIMTILISCCIALLTGIPIMSLSLQSNFFLSFNYAPPTYYILNFGEIASILFYSAITLTIFVNVLRLRKLSDVSIAKLERLNEQNEPMWKRYYFDIFILIISSIASLGIFYFIKNPAQTQSLSLVINEFVILILPIPLFFILGLLLFFDRLTPIIFEQIGLLLWKRNGNILSFSFKNILRFKEVSRKAIFLISILITFLIFFYSLPYSFVANNEDNLYYQNGADGLASFTKGYNQSELNTIGTQYSQYFNSYSPYVILTTQDKISLNSYAIMFVNLTSYLQTAYLHFDLELQNKIEDDFNSLNDSNLSNKDINVLIDQTSLENGKSSLEQDITIFGSNESLTMHIVDSFRNWPLLQYEYSKYTTLCIADLNYYLQSINKSIFKTVFTKVNEEGILFNFKNSVNQTQISNWIEGNTSISFSGLTSVEQENYISGIQFRSTIGQINNDVIMIIILSTIVLILFSYFLLDERKKELLLMRAIGMKLNQLSILFIIETTIIMISSIIIGLITGLFLTQIVILLLFNPLQSYPVFIAIYPFDIIIFTITLLFTLCLVFSLVPSYSLSKQEISKAFGEN